MSEDPRPNLAALRAQIDDLDHRIIDLLAERIQTLGGIAVGDPRHAAELTWIPRPPDGAEEVPVMIGRLLDAHELIITVARRLKSSLRSGDILARTGGDEFAISSRVSGGKADVREMARRIRGCFDHPFRIGELKVSVDCAIGCAIQPAVDTDIADQIRHGQIALKRAKRSA